MWLPANINVRPDGVRQAWATTFVLRARKPKKTLCFYVAMNHSGTKFLFCVCVCACVHVGVVWVGRERERERGKK